MKMQRKGHFHSELPKALKNGALSGNQDSLPTGNTYACAIAALQLFNARPGIAQQQISKAGQNKQ